VFLKDIMYPTYQKGKLPSSHYMGKGGEVYEKGGETDTQKKNSPVGVKV